jgi:hypothetical protein
VNLDASTVSRIVAGCVSLACTVIVLRLGRRGRLSFRYTVGWILLFGMGVLSALVLPLVEPIADTLEVTPAAIVAVLGLLLLLAICVQLSVSISGTQEQIRRLSEKIAMLESQVRPEDNDSAE